MRGRRRSSRPASAKNQRAIEERRSGQDADAQGATGKIKRAFYEKEIERLQVELVKLQEYISSRASRSS